MTRWPPAITFLLVRAILTPLLFAIPGVPAAAQKGATVAFKQFQHDVHLTEKDQRTPAVQKHYQVWFLGCVRRYHHLLDHTAVSTLVHLGDVNAIRNRLAPPAGHGDWTIVWRDQHGKGPTKEPGEPFYFPLDVGDIRTYFHPPDNPELVATCWHEAQHGFLGSENLSAPGFWAADQEHYYIEHYAQNTVEWLWWLNVSQKFEARARKAWRAEKAYRARGIRLSFALQGNLWSSANEAWHYAWSRLTRNGRFQIASPPAPLRKEYERISGVRVPLVEAVIAFYMQGGLTDGKEAIRVPRWVMTRREIRLTPRIELTGGNGRRTVDKNGGLRHTFHVRIFTRAPEAHGHWGVRGVDQGLLTFALEDRDADTWIGVRQDGQDVARAKGAPSRTPWTVRVRLADRPDPMRKLIPFEITFAYRNVKRLHGTRRYTIRVGYTDAPPKGRPAAYHPSEAVFFVILTAPRTSTSGRTSGKGKPAAPPAPSAPAPIPAGGTRPSPATGPSTRPPGPAGPTARPKTTAAPAKPLAVWRLTRTTTERFHGDGAAAARYTMRGGAGHATTGVSLGTPGTSSYCSIEARSTWTGPPPEIPVHDLYNPTPFQMTFKVEDGRAVPAKGLPWWSNLTYYEGAVQKDFAGTGVNGQRVTEKTVSSSHRNPGARQKTVTGYAPAAGDAPGPRRFTVTIRAHATATGHWAAVQTLYEYTLIRPSLRANPPVPPPSPGALKKKVPPPITVVKQRKDPPPPPPPPEVQPDPPKPGNVVKVDPVPPPGKHRRHGTRWYVHPSGEYRFPLPKGWTHSRRLSDREADVLVREGGRIQVRAEIEFEEIGDVTPEAHFKDLDRRARENVPVLRTSTRRVRSGHVHVVETKGTAEKPGQIFVFYVNRRRFLPLIVVPSRGATPEDRTSALAMLLDPRFKEEPRK